MYPQPVRGKLVCNMMQNATRITGMSRTTVDISLFKLNIGF